MLYRLLFVALSVNSVLSLLVLPNHETAKYASLSVRYSMKDKNAVHDRRQWLFQTVAATTLLTTTFNPERAVAKGDPVEITQDTVDKAFGAIEGELQTGGIAYLEQQIGDQNFEALLEYTKTYDQILRKGYMGKAKKLLPKDTQGQATQLGNNVTFDLIGINRSSRPGQENIQNCNKYLQELKNDVQAFVNLKNGIAL